MHIFVFLLLHLFLSLLSFSLWFSSQSSFSLRLSFSQKRKRLANSLASSYSKQKVFECLSSLSLSENTRAEELSPETFLELFLRLK